MKKSKTPRIDLTGYHYTSHIPALEIFPLYALISPIRRSDIKKSWNSNPSIIELVALIGVDLKNKKFAKAIKTHQKRMRFHFVISGLITGVLYISIGMLAIASIIVMLFFVGLLKESTQIVEGFGSGIAFTLGLIVLYIAFRLAGRITSVVIDRYYADTLAFIACLQLLIHTIKDDSLMLTDDRQCILVRIRALRYYLVLLAYQYLGPELNSTNWARSQFRQMENFVLEKENQVIAPLADTQSKIIDELYSLLMILLTCQYGEFKYAGIIGEINEPMLSQTNRARSRLLKFLGVAIPILLLVANFLFKDQFQAIGLDTQVVALIGLAWFLLAIDANLNLGIIDRISTLGKAIRELR